MGAGTTGLRIFERLQKDDRRIRIPGPERSAGCPPAVRPGPDAQAPEGNAGHYQTGGRPVFCPVVGDFYSGMQVTVPLFASWLAPCKEIGDIKAEYRSLYTGPIVTFSLRFFITNLSYRSIIAQV